MADVVRIDDVIARLFFTGRLRILSLSRERLEAYLRKGAP
jgi:hypothetical protein